MDLINSLKENFSNISNLKIFNKEVSKLEAKINGAFTEVWSTGSDVPVIDHYSSKIILDFIYEPLNNDHYDFPFCLKINNTEEPPILNFDKSIFIENEWADGIFVFKCDNTSSFEKNIYMYVDGKEDTDYGPFSKTDMYTQFGITYQDWENNPVIGIIYEAFNDGVYYNVISLGAVANISESPYPIDIAFFDKQNESEYSFDPVEYGTIWINNNMPFIHIDNIEFRSYDDVNYENIPDVIVSFFNRYHISKFIIHYIPKDNIWGDTLLTIPTAFDARNPQDDYYSIKTNGTDSEPEFSEIIPYSYTIKNKKSSLHTGDTIKIEAVIEPNRILYFDFSGDPYPDEWIIHQNSYITINSRNYKEYIYRSGGIYKTMIHGDGQDDVLYDINGFVRDQYGRIVNVEIKLLDSNYNLISSKKIKCATKNSEEVLKDESEYCLIQSVRENENELIFSFRTKNEGSDVDIDNDKGITIENISSSIISINFEFNSVT